MSADNLLGVFKMADGTYQGFNVWSEDENPTETIKGKTPIFTAKSLKTAVIKAQKEIGNPDAIYEYGIRFYNI